MDTQNAVCGDLGGWSEDKKKGSNELFRYIFYVYSICLRSARPASFHFSPLFVGFPHQNKEGDDRTHKYNRQGCVIEYLIKIHGRSIFAS
jgi:hypothetical protein